MAVFVLVVFGAFLIFLVDIQLERSSGMFKLQVFATLILGASGRNNIFQLLLTRRLIHFASSH